MPGSEHHVILRPGRLSRSAAAVRVLGLMVLGLLALGCAESRDAPSANGSGATAARAELKASLFRMTEAWLSVNDERSNAVRLEMTALHFAVATLGVSRLNWSEAKTHEAMLDLSDSIAAVVGASVDRSPRQLRAYLRDRAPLYLQATPASSGRLTEADLRALGAVFVEGVMSHPDAPAEPPVQDEDVWELSIGQYYMARFQQFMEKLEGIR